MSPEAEIAAVRLSEYHNYAAVDAIIEPLLNGFWFYFLHSLWKKNN